MAFGQIFSRDTQAIFFNWKPNPVQRMLDFDFLCGTPAAILRTCKHQPGACRSSQARPRGFAGRFSSLQ